MKETGRSSVFKEKGSRFLGITYKITDPKEIKHIISQVKNTKDTSGGSHYIYGYRITVHGVLREGKSDDGEKGAGINILMVMQTLDIMDSITVVIRWYGGKHIGGKRFTNIKKAAAESIRRG